MMKSLKGTCEDVILKGFSEGNYQNMTLDVKMSNLLFEKLIKRGCKLPVVEAFKGWNITKFEGIYDLTEDHFELIKAAQNVEVLELEYIEDSGNFKLEKTESGTETPISVCSILQQVLSPSSRNTLKKLTIHGSAMAYCNLQLGFLTNLQHLNIPDVELAENDFAEICENFKNTLRELDISNSGLTNLTHIKVLKKLEILTISELNITEKSGLEGVLELKNLKVLVIQNSDLAPKMLADCGSRLPELRYLDLSFSDVTEEMVEALVKKHPKLELIGLIGTQLEFGYELSSSSGVKLLTLNTLKDCTDSLRFYSKQESISRFAKFFRQRIFDEINFLTTDMYEEQPEGSLRELIHELVDVLKRKNVQWNSEIMWALIALLQNDRVLIFEPFELNSIISDLLENFEVNQPGRHTHDIYECLWKILANPYLLDRLSTPIIDKICCYGLNLINKFCQSGFEYLVQTVSTCLPKCSPKILLELSRNDRILQNLIITFSKFFEHSLMYFPLLDIVLLLSSYIEEPWIAISLCHIPMVMEGLERYIGFQGPRRQAAFENVEKMVGKMDPMVLGEFFNGRNLRVFRFLIAYKTHDQKKLTVSLLVKIMDCSGKLADFTLSTEQKIQIVMDLIEEYEEIDGYFYDSVTAFFDFSSQLESESYGKTMAKTILDFHKMECGQEQVTERRAIEHY